VPTDGCAQLEARGDGRREGDDGGVGMTDRSGATSTRHPGHGHVLEVDEDVVDPDEIARVQLAYAIHDGLTQVITASVLELESVAHRAEIDPREATDALYAAIAELRRALDEVRRVLAELTPVDHGAARSIEDLLRSVLERWHLPATWSVEGDLAELPASVLETASSVIREGVANAAKHAGDGEVAVRVQASGRAVEVTVEDRGRGFETSAADTVEGHLGLDMLRRRVADAHGTLDVSSAPGKGTRVVARLPVTDKE
jgi:signal transduction histidine kinase